VFIFRLLEGGERLVDDQDTRKAASGDSCLALCHELSERLTAAGNYFTAFQRLFETRFGRAPAQPGEVLEKALSQLAQASQLVHQLRPMLTKIASLTAAPARQEGGYRICFLNQFACGAKTITGCQRSIVIRSAKTREDAIEKAKKRFAELEGVPDWRLHAQTVEVTALDTEPEAARAA
jgi:hypothetical protein